MNPLSLMICIIIVGFLLLITIRILKIVFKHKRIKEQRDHEKRTQQLMQQQLYMQQQMYMQQQQQYWQQQQQQNQRRK